MALLALGPALTSAVGCGSGNAPWPATTVTDSAGVLLVENAGPIPLDGGGWSVATEPFLSIGTVGGDPDYQLYAVAGVHRFPDGRVAVVNAGTQQVRIYSDDGSFLSAFGERGAGPEEFEMPVLAGTVGKRLIIVDRAHHRLSLLHPDSGFVGLARISDEVGGYLNPVGGFQNGETVYGGAFDMRRIGELHNGMNRAHTFYRSSALDGSFLADFGDKEGADFFIMDLEGEGQDARPAVIPFGRIPVAAVSPHFFYFSDQDAYEVEVYDPAGALRMIVRLDVPPVPVTPEDGERHIRSVVDQVGSPDQAPGIRAYLSALPLPDHFPPHGNLLADALDCLWVEDFQRPGAETRAWNVFDPEGALRGRVTLPDRFAPTEIGGDYVLGVGWDEMNVEYVRAYALTRGSGAG